MPADLTFNLDSPEATAAFARRLAPALGAGDVVLLSGDIGAGKSHFARAAIAERLAMTGRAEDIPSPTYTLVQVYDAGPLSIWHCDLYRLSDPEEAVELGVWDAFETALCFVEWPEKLGDLTPENALHCHFSPGSHGDQRVARFTMPDGRLGQALTAAAACSEPAA